MTYVTTEDELQTASALVAFRAPANLVVALDKARADDLCSRSDVARRALLDHLRQRGFLPEVLAALKIQTQNKGA